MDVYLLKSLHIIFIVTWFAGLFYIVRLFIYHTEANDKPEPDKSILFNQYKIMEKRLWYIITWPSFIITIILGPWLLIQHHAEKLTMGWMHLKLGFVILLSVYHLITHRMFKQFQRDEIKFNSTKLRLWNEVATLLLFVIVFLIVYQRLDFYYGIFGFFGLTISLMLGIKMYKKIRNKKDSK